MQMKALEKIHSKKKHVYPNAIWLLMLPPDKLKCQEGMLTMVQSWKGLWPNTPPDWSRWMVNSHTDLQTFPIEGRKSATALSNSLYELPMLWVPRTQTLLLYLSPVKNLENKLITSHHAQENCLRNMWSIFTTNKIKYGILSRASACVVISL